MHANFPSSTSTEQFWVADIGATTHMTSDIAQLNLATPFSGSDTIATADGSGLSISNVVLLFWMFHSAHSNYHKLCMCLSYHNTCYQFIGYVKITITDSFVMPLVFAFRTSLQEGFFSRD
jgi:hypothetical protein